MRAAVVYDDALLLWSRLFAGSRACHTSNTFSTQLPYGAPGRGVVSFREAGDVPANRAAPELPGSLHRVSMDCLSLVPTPARHALGMSPPRYTCHPHVFRVQRQGLWPGGLGARWPPAAGLGRTAPATMHLIGKPGLWAEPAQAPCAKPVLSPRTWHAPPALMKHANYLYPKIWFHNGRFSFTVYHAAPRRGAA